MAERRRNPFVNQVFVVLRKFLGSGGNDGRNPFVNQVFVVRIHRIHIGQRRPSQSLRKSGLCRRTNTAEQKRGSHRRVAIPS